MTQTVAIRTTNIALGNFFQDHFQPGLSRRAFKLSFPRSNAEKLFASHMVKVHNLRRKLNPAINTGMISSLSDNVVERLLLSAIRFSRFIEIILAPVTRILPLLFLIVSHNQCYMVAEKEGANNG